MKKNLTTTEVRKIIERYRIKMGRFKINDDGTIDVKGDVLISNTNLKKLPLLFRTVHGDFKCKGNELLTLKGAPKHVEKSFDCSHNELTSLKHGPTIVGRDYDCSNNNLKDLVGSPGIINGDFICYINRLVTLEGGPKEVKMNYGISYNLLKNLQGAAEKVGGNFFAAENDFEDLKGCPKFIGHTLYLGINIKNINIGASNCILQAVVFKYPHKIDDSFLLPRILYDNQQHLRLVMKYHDLLDLWDENGELNEENFNDMIFEIKDGFR